MKKTELKAASYGTLLQKKRATMLKEEDAASTPQENSGEEIKVDPLLPEKAKSVTYVEPVHQDDDDLDKERDDMEEDEDMDQEEDTDENTNEIGDMEEEEDEDDDAYKENDEDKDDDADLDQDEDTGRYYAHDFTEENEYVDEMYGDSYLTHIHSNRM